MASRPLYKLDMTFDLTKPDTLEEIVKIFYDSEMNPGTWGKHFIVNLCQCSGTIHGNYFFQPFTSLEETTTLLLNLFLAIFGDRREPYSKDALKFMMAKLTELSSMVGGSTGNPYDIMRNIEERKLFANDTLNLTFSLSRQSPTMSRFTPDELNHPIIDDKTRAMFKRFKSAESLKRIIDMRMHNDAAGAATAEFEVPEDELYQLREEYANTAYENAHNWPDSDNASSSYNLRPRNTIDYAQYLNSRNNKTFNRRKRRIRNYRGQGVSHYQKYFNILDDHYNELRNYIKNKYASFF